MINGSGAVYKMLRHVHRHLKHVNARWMCSQVSPYSWAVSDHVDRSLCCDEHLIPSDLQVMQEVITEEQEQRLADEAATMLRRRRYETDHWDQVIVNFKEMETSKWTSEAKEILNHLRTLPIMPSHLTYFPTVHVIDLAAEGYIKPHVDSVKFSGQIVAGISLLSPSVMRFKEEHGPSQLDAFLPRRSFYCMSGGIRYRYTHEILPLVQSFHGQEVTRTRRISIMFRDVFDDTAKKLAQDMAELAQARSQLTSPNFTLFAVKLIAMECPGTPRPSAQEVQDVIDKRDRVFGLGGSLELTPRPSPNNPSRGVPTRDRTYRSLFQQPAIDVQLAHTEHDWYDFLFNPKKLLLHTQALLKDPTSTPTAHDVLTELLRKVKNPSSLAAYPTNPAASNEVTLRQKTLLCLAALVVLELQFDLDAIETTVPTHLQSLLLDGIVEYATNPQVLRLDEAKKMTVDEATIFRGRWQIRLALKKMHVSPVTLVSKLPLSDNPKPPPDEVEQLNGIMLPPIAQVIDDIEQRLNANVHLQYLANYDIGVYHFHKKNFSQAMTCFNRSKDATQSPKPALIGYVQACEAVLGISTPEEKEFTNWWNQRDWKSMLSFLKDERSKILQGTKQVLSQRFCCYIESQTIALYSSSHDDDLVGLQKVYILLLIQHILLTKELSPVKAALCKYYRLQGLDKQKKFLLDELDDVLSKQFNATVKEFADTINPPLVRNEEELRSTKRQRLHYAHIKSPNVSNNAIQNALIKGNWSALRDSDASPLVIAVAALMEYTSTNLATFSTKKALTLLEAVLTTVKESKSENPVVDLPIAALDTIISLCAGLLQRAYAMNLCEYRISYDLVPYGDLAIMIAFGPNDSGIAMDPVQSMKMAQSDIVKLHQTVLSTLLLRCPREPRWHCAMADVYVNPIVLQKLSSVGDFKSALKHYLAATMLATNFFSDAGPIEELIDHSSLVRLSQCLVKIGDHVAAAVLYQCFPTDEVTYGLRILQMSPQSHNAIFFQYIWELPFLEMLVHLHSNTKHRNLNHVALLTQLIQCPELNASNPASSKREMEIRILRSYFRELCRVYLD